MFLVKASFNEGLLLENSRPGREAIPLIGTETAPCAKAAISLIEESLCAQNNSDRNVYLLESERRVRRLCMRWRENTMQLNNTCEEYEKEILHSKQI